MWHGWGDGRDDWEGHRGGGGWRDGMHGGEWRDHMWGDDQGFVSGGIGTMWLWWLLAAGLVVVFVLVTVWLMGRVRGAGVAPAVPSPSVVGPSGGARQILEERLARGEIDPEEFRERLAALGGSGSA